MTNRFLTALVICFGIIQNIFGQSLMDMAPEFDTNVKSEFEGAMKTMNVSMNLSPHFTATQNTGLIYPAGDDYKPSIDQIYGHETCSGNTELNVIFTGVHSILTHSSGDYKIMVYASGERNIIFGKQITENNQYFNVINSTFNRIKGDFRYGIPNKSATVEELEELDMMVKHCPEEQAKEMFNAKDVIMYPLSLRGNAFEDKYTRCRTVIVAKNGLSIFFYFLMTDESVKNFNQYLDDLSDSFRYN